MRSPERRKGQAAIIVASFFFAATNNIAKLLYWRGATEVSLFLLRGIFVYALNGLLVVMRRQEKLADILFLRVGWRRRRLLLIRGICGVGLILTLNIGYHFYLTVADAFSIFLGVMTLGTVLATRLCLSRSERLTLRQLAGGGFVLCGLLLVTQPTVLFGGNASCGAQQIDHMVNETLDETTSTTRRQAGSCMPLPGVLLVGLSGALATIFNILTRICAQQCSSSTLLSAYMITIFAISLAISLVSSAGMMNRSADVATAWAVFRPPDRLDEMLLYGGYFVTLMASQLILAEGYRRVPAAEAAILNLSELAFAYLLDVTLLREPTSVAAACGTAVVFAGSAFVAAKARDDSDKALLNAQEAHTAASVSVGTSELVQPGDGVTMGVTTGMVRSPAHVEQQPRSRQQQQQQQPNAAADKIQGARACELDSTPPVRRLGPPI